MESCTVLGYNKNINSKGSDFLATQMQLARQGIITEAMKQVAAYEGVTEEFIRKGVAEGTIAIPLNINHKNVTPRGVGQGLSVKVNANIGTSSSFPERDGFIHGRQHRRIAQGDY